MRRSSSMGNVRTLGVLEVMVEDMVEDMAENRASLSAPHLNHTSQQELQHASQHTSQAALLVRSRSSSELSQSPNPHKPLRRAASQNSMSTLPRPALSPRSTSLLGQRLSLSLGATASSMHDHASASPIAHPSQVLGWTNPGC